MCEINVTLVRSLLHLAVFARYLRAAEAILSLHIPSELHLQGDESDLIAEDWLNSEEKYW